MPFDRGEYFIAARPRFMPRQGFPPVMVFPEGTTTNNSEVLTFQAGAFRAGRPVHVYRYVHAPHVPVTPGLACGASLMPIVVHYELSPLSIHGVPALT
jgi:1-acyl-sn-glycerol-3-phosphate acyltransferase